ncbi:MAG: 16S rRNA (guanine(527)-N(7))-methyltransferase RsmG [Gammaproteobacteria bacterium]|nr:16S rRNA (guanine(527)-N(7))-methyltransferase RsmG [Gammaproteobacteria bacterium]
MSNVEQSIRQGATALGQQLEVEQVARLATLLNELGRWNRRINLTAIRDPDGMVGGHILDSLAVRPMLRGPAVLDIGTGAGFPGLPLAIVESGMDFVLLDSNGKKISFVNHMIGELGLENAEAVKARAEDYAPGKRFDTVIARALATVPRLVELSAHLVGEDGQLLALKGKYPAEELEAIKTLPEWEFTVTPVEVPGLEAHARHIVSLERKKARS